MRKSLTLFLLVIPVFLSAQQWKRVRKEIVYGAGATNCLTDLGGANQIGTYFVKDFEVSMTRPALLFGYRYRLNKSTSVRGNIHYGRLKGNDQLTREIARNTRNIVVRTDLVEIGGQLEYMFLKERAGHRYQIKGVRGWRNINIQTYLFGGFAVFLFNPQGPYNGKWYSLQPFGTEGQGIRPGTKKYSRVNVALPGGIGFKYGISRIHTIGLELGMRKTFTDYLDDTSTDYYDQAEITSINGAVAGHFSNPAFDKSNGFTAAGQQRGNPTKNDTYMFVVITLSKKLVPHRTKAKF